MQEVECRCSVRAAPHRWNECLEQEIGRGYRELLDGSEPLVVSVEADGRYAVNRRLVEGRSPELLAASVVLR